MMKKTGTWMVAAVVLIALTMASSLSAHRAFRIVVRPTRIVRPVVAPVRVRPVSVVAPAAFGRVDFNVHPSQSRVFVDGVYIGVADDFDGGLFGSTATLRAGTHHVKIVSPDGRIVTRKIYVMAGKELDFNLDF